MAFADIILQNPGSAFDINLSTSAGAIAGVTGGLAIVSGTIICKAKLSGTIVGVSGVSGVGKCIKFLKGIIDAPAGGVALTDDFEAYTEGSLIGQGNWLSCYGIVNVVSDSGDKRIRPASTGVEIGVRRSEKFSNDQWAQGTLDKLGNMDIGVAVHALVEDGHSRYIAYYAGGMNVYAGWVADGVWHGLGYDISTTNSVGDTFKIIIQGTTVSFYHNGSLDTRVGGGGQYTVPTFMRNGGSPGLAGWSSHADTQLDNWIGEDLTPARVRGLLTAEGELSGSADGVATVSGTLTGKAKLTNIGEELILVGGFEYGTEWGTAYGGWTIAGDVATFDDEVTDELYQVTAISFVSGNRYRVKFDLNATGATGTLNILRNTGADFLFSYPFNSAYLYADGSYSFHVSSVYTGSTCFEIWGIYGGGIFTVDNVSLKDATNAVQGVAIVTGTLTAKGKLYGATDGVAIVTGTLTAKGKLYGAIDGVATVSGDLKEQAATALIGSTDGVATVSGNLKGKGKLYGSTTGVATVSGDLGYVISIANIEGSTDGVAIVSGILKGHGKLYGTTLGVALLSATPKAKGKLYGSTTGVATVSGTIRSKIYGTGRADGITLVSGVLHGHGKLYGTTTGVALVGGTLRGKGGLKGFLQAGLKNSMTSYWKLNDAASPAVDSYKTRDLTIYGAPTLQAPAILDTGIHFLTTGDYLYSATAGNMVGQLVSEFSVAFRIKLDILPSVRGTAHMYPFRIVQGVTSDNIKVGLPYNAAAADAVYFGVYDANLVAKYAYSSDLVIDTWYHVVCVAKVGQAMKIYINGAYDVVGTPGVQSGLIVPGSGKLYISGTSSNNVVGTMDDICTFLRALSAEEAAALHNSGNGLPLEDYYISVSGTLTPRAWIHTSVSGAAIVSGTLHGHGKLYGVTNGVTTVNGNLKLGAIKGHTDGVALVSGILHGRGKLYGVTNGTAVVSGINHAKGKLYGTTSGIAIISGILKGRGKLYANTNGVALISGSVRAKGKLYGSISSVALLGGVLGGKGDLSGEILSYATLTATLLGTGELAGHSDGIATTGAFLRTPGSARGIINGVAVVSGTIRSFIYAAGITNGVASVSGEMWKYILGELISGNSTITPLIEGDSLITILKSGNSTITPLIEGDSLITILKSGNSLIKTTMGDYSLIIDE